MHLEERSRFYPMRIGVYHGKQTEIPKVSNPPKTGEIVIVKRKVIADISRARNCLQEAKAEAKHVPLLEKKLGELINEVEATIEYVSEAIEVVVEHMPYPAADIAGRVVHLRSIECNAFFYGAKVKFPENYIWTIC